MYPARPPHRASGVLFSTPQTVYVPLTRWNHRVVRRRPWFETFLAAPRRREGQRKSMRHPNGIMREETVDETHLINNEDAKDQTNQP
jgi:hypothetical protein